MSLAEEVAKRKAQQRADAARQADPELEARLDRFIAENPQVVERLHAMSRDELVRKLMAEKMERAESIANRNRELEPWVREHPEIIPKVEQRLTNLAKARDIESGIRHAEKHSQQRGPRIHM